MAGLIKKYVIGRNRLLKGHAEGFVVQPDGTLRSEPRQPVHLLYLGRLDSGRTDCEWGRVAFTLEMPGEMVLVLRAFATNETAFMNGGEVAGFDSFLLSDTTPNRQKQALFQAAGAVKAVGKDDVLLYGQNGRYLYLALELLGEGDAAMRDIAVYAPGENFLHTFPEVYRGDSEFFRRWLSIFSSLYNDMQQQVEGLDRIIDVDAAPPGLLVIFASWLGLEIEGGFLEERQLRRLVREAFSLICKKGTREALERVVGVLLEDEPVYIVEQVLLQRQLSGEDALQSQRLYGGDPYGFTLLLNREADEKLHARLNYLIDQFKPLRSRVNIVFIKDQAVFDSYCCMDVNARLAEPGGGELDTRAAMNGMICLQ